MSTIQHTNANDLPFIYQLFEEAIQYQQRKGFPVWNGYDKQVLIEDVEKKRQYKVMGDNEIMCVFSVCYTDPIIWREREKGDALYLHRIVVNPKHKGQRQFEKIVTWATEWAKHNNRRFLRMDTWGNNPSILNYYQSFGFTLVEHYTTPNSNALPQQHRNLFLALLEYQVL